MKRLTALFALSIAAALAQTTPTINLVPVNQGQVKPGSTVDVNVSLQAPAGGISGVQFTLTGAPTGSTVTWSPGLNTTSTGKAVSCASGTPGVMCLVVGPNTTLFGDGYLAVMHVPVPASVSGTFTLNLTNVIAVSPAGDQTALVAGTPLGFQGASPCDINNDGLVTDADYGLSVTQTLDQIKGLACSSALLTGTATGCSVVDVQRFAIAARGGSCKLGQ